MVHPGALGDVLVAVPALRALKAASPDHTLVLAAQPRIGELLTLLGVVDRCVSFDALGLGALFVDAPTPARVPALASAARVVCWFGARDPVFARRLRAAVPDVIVAPPACAGSPVWPHLLTTVTAPSTDGWRHPLTVPLSLIDTGQRALIAAGWDGTTPVLMIHPGAGGASKRWSADGFAAVVDGLATATPLAVFIHQGPADQDAVAMLSARLRVAARVIGEPTLPELAGALSHVVAYLGNDSGVSHLAAAVGVHAVVLFTQEMLEWRPWAPNARVLVVSAEVLNADDIVSVRDAVSDLVNSAREARR